MKKFVIPLDNWFHQVIAGENVTNVFVGSERKDSSLPIIHPYQRIFRYRISYDLEVSSYRLEIFYDFKLAYTFDFLEYNSILPLLNGYFVEFVTGDC